jgi:tetratricopeptide (TPR) repeat protein
VHKKSFNVFITFLIFLIGFSLTGRSHDSASAVDIIRKIIQESGIQAANCRFVEMKSDSKQKSLFVEDEFTSLGYQLINKGMIPEAVAVLEMAVSAFPKSWNVLIQLGDAYALDGNKKEALEAYKKSLKLYTTVWKKPGFPASMNRVSRPA